MPTTVRLPSLRAVGLALGDAVCAALAADIALHAVRDWPARYLHHTLSWSVSAFFAVSIALAISGPIAALFYLRAGKSETAAKAALLPVLWFGLGAAIGFIKLAMTGDF